MLKASAQIAPTGTKARIVEAALETLKEEGFAGASARAIARRGGFNQALVFYHFGSVSDLLLAALDETSRRRMASYQAALEDVSSVEDLMTAAIRLYREDLASGHITVLAEMIAGSIASPRLKEQIAAHVEPWVDFAERAIETAAARSPVAAMVPARELAYGVVALYLGVEMLSQLQQGDERVDSLFTAAGSLGTTIIGMLGSR